MNKSLTLNQMAAENIYMNIAHPTVVCFFREGGYFFLNLPFIERSKNKINNEKKKLLAKKSST